MRGGMIMDNYQHCRTNYTDNKINGLYEGWYYNGQLKYRMNYTSGKLNGQCEAWESDGHIFMKAIYLDDVELTE
jgi:antitoxin component YwqK of YwqJK toxin-antitoxin module